MINFDLGFCVYLVTLIVESVELQSQHRRRVVQASAVHRDERAVLAADVLILLDFS